MSITLDHRFEINLPMLMRALTFYQNRGYRPIAAAQCVSMSAINVTLPDGATPLAHDEDNFYVGSAEQSFYQMMTNYKENDTPMVPAGRFMMLTPCQRDEKNKDDTHLEIFLKLELISFDGHVISDALQFFKREGLTVEEVETEVGIDIECNGIELGSYGKREHEGETVWFGTGVAMPRICYAKAKSLGVI